MLSEYNMAVLTVLWIIVHFLVKNNNSIVALCDIQGWFVGVIIHGVSLDDWNHSFIYASLGCVVMFHSCVVDHGFDQIWV